MFRKLQTRLTVLYAALFGVVLLMLSGVVYGVASEQAKGIAAKVLASSGEVFDRVWALRADRLQGGAALLARDFGFREALASHDRPTIVSAVDNLRGRLDIDTAFVLDTEGAIVADAGDGAAGLAAKVRGPLMDTAQARGVVVVDGAPFEVVSAPILAPDPKGFIVFAVRLGADQMRAIQQMSAVALMPAVAWREGGRWRAATPLPRLDAQFAAAQDGQKPAPALVNASDGRVLALVRRLSAPEGLAPVALVLTYPLSAALAPYRVLFWAIVLVGLVGLGLVIAGSWALAAGVTRPLSRLADAARRLREGEAVHIAVAGRDEVGALAADFNAMADAVAERERTISRSALMDAETQIPNRRWLETALRTSRREPGEGRWFVATFGIDRYARMRGAVGYTLSTDLLTALWLSLEQALPEWRFARTATDVIAAAYRARDAVEAQALALKAREVLEGGHTVGEHHIDVRVAVGLSDGEGRDQLLPEAELALDAARAEGAAFKRYDKEASRRASESLSLMPDLRTAIDRDALTLAHQPKYDARRQAITGVESLVRWTHPSLGPMRPDRFVSMAEETGDIRALSEWVFRRAVAEQAAMVDGGHDLAFSINLSGRLLGDAAFTRFALDTLSQAKGPICLEITETAVMGAPEAAVRAIDRFAEAGIAVSLDDYGTGLCALAYIKRLRASELKLDRSLVCDVAASARDALLVRSTVDLAHGLGMKVVAEGVEDETSLSILIGMGCDLIQGYRIAPPLALPELTAFLAGPPRSAEVKRA
jgi:EAL domain-containing protein (putative c-di-GMP-specific phosphodiesterase class I)/HAMP domain-containing protein